MFLKESQVTCVYCCTEINTVQTAYLFKYWKEEGRGCYSYWVLVLSYFELFNFVDQNNGEEKGITILVQKKFSV